MRVIAHLTAVLPTNGWEKKRLVGLSSSVKNAGVCAVCHYLVNDSSSQHFNYGELLRGHVRLWARVLTFFAENIVATTEVQGLPQISPFFFSLTCGEELRVRGKNLARVFFVDALNFESVVNIA